MNALVIDDSRAMRTILGGILRGVGYEVAEAGHGREGLERLRAQPDTRLVLVDWNMPEMDGLAFVRAARAERTYDSTVLIIVSTETELAQVRRALEAGANEYVMKPFTKDTVLAKLELLGLP